jgi:hypothetical protein
MCLAVAVDEERATKNETKQNIARLKEENAQLRDLLGITNIELEPEQQPVCRPPSSQPPPYGMPPPPTNNGPRKKFME